MQPRKWEPLTNGVLGYASDDNHMIIWDSDSKHFKLDTTTQLKSMNVDEVISQANVILNRRQAR